MKENELEPVCTTAEHGLSGLFPAILRRFPLQSVRIAGEIFLSVGKIPAHPAFPGYEYRRFKELL